MSWRPPVPWRVLPTVRATRLIALAGFWVFAIVGARALVYHMTMALTFALLVGSIVVAIGNHRGEREPTARMLDGALAAIPSFAILYRAQGRLGVALAGGVLTGLAFGAAMRSFKAHAEALDRDVQPNAAVAIWLALAALHVRLGSETGHLHQVFPSLALLMTFGATLLAAAVTLVAVAQRRWTRRLYGTNDESLAIGPPPAEMDLATIPALSGDEADAVVLLFPAEVNAYRGQPSVVARAPASPDRVLQRQARMVGMGALGCLSSALALLVLPSASNVHEPEFPSAGNVATRLANPPATLRFVALEPLVLDDVERIAERYRRVGFHDVRVERPMPFEERFFDRRRGQLNGDDVARAAQRAYVPSRTMYPRELVIVLTDRDLFREGVPWPYAFAVDDFNVDVVSLARLDPSFPLFASSSYVPRRPSCAAALHERTYKLITHRISSRTDGPFSNVDGLSAIDGIAEGN